LRIEPNLYERIEPLLMPMSFAMAFSGLRTLCLLEIKTSAVTRLLTLLPAFPLLEELMVMHTHAAQSAHPHAETVLIQSAYDHFIDELTEVLQRGQLRLPHLKRLRTDFEPTHLRASGPAGPRWEHVTEETLIAVLPATAALWRLLDVCLVSTEYPALVKRWIPTLAPDVDYRWRPFGALNNGPLQLHMLAQKWPLAFDGFEDMHDVLVAAGADASFTPVMLDSVPHWANKTAMQLHHERCQERLMLEEEEDEEDDGEEEDEDDFLNDLE
jgi:hypothetical protein